MTKPKFGLDFWEQLRSKTLREPTAETIKWDRLAGAIARILHSQPEGT